MMLEERIDCERFEELWKRASGAEPDPEAERLLRAHAEECQECAAWLRLRGHTAIGADADLEKDVPDDLVRGMWDRVSAEIDAPRRRRGVRGGGRLRERLVPIQAAAIVLLAIGVGALFVQTRELRERERELAARLEARESLVLSARTTASVFRFRSALAAGRIEEATPVSLRRAIAALPAGTTLLGPAETERALARLPLRFGAARAIREGIRIDDGLQAFEALRLLDAAPIEPNEPIPVRRLFPRPGKATGREAL